MTARSAFVLLAGRPVLDLCNTRLGDADLLDGPAALARWFEETRMTDRSPPISEREVRAARGLRDGLRPALLATDGPGVARIAEDWLGRAPGRLCVQPDTLTPRFAPEAGTSCCLLVEVVLDALDLVRESPGRVRECAAPRCFVVYLDTSRNRSRRWCSMERCGARAKASAYYRRHRAEASAGGQPGTLGR
jgi:predicted RNA-binding Zn ribbon-like protein